MKSYSLLKVGKGLRVLARGGWVGGRGGGREAGEEGGEG